MTSQRNLCTFQQEPLGGAHADPSWTSQQIKKAINESMDVSAFLTGIPKRIKIY
jgi:hypothetical protein